MSIKIGVVFLINKPNDNTIDFALEIKEKSNFDVFVIIDDTKKYYGKSFKGINVFQMPDESCGVYKNCAYIENATQLKKNPSAWDKFLLHFCENVSYDFVWVFEDDVFIPSVETIINLHNKYLEFDLVTPNNFFKNDNIMDWHWPKIIDKIDPPYFCHYVGAKIIKRQSWEAFQPSKC